MINQHKVYFKLLLSCVRASMNKKLKYGRVKRNRTEMLHHEVKNRW